MLVMLRPSPFLRLALPSSRLKTWTAAASRRTRIPAPSRHWSRRAPGGARWLVATIVALHRAGNIKPAQLLDGVIAHPVLENVPPRVGECPKCAGDMGAHRRAFGPRRAFALAALHFLAHLRVHPIQREIA